MKRFVRIIGEGVDHGVRRLHDKAIGGLKINAFARVPGEPAPAFRHAFADLNGDGRDDAIVLMTGSTWCGTGGCDMAVFRGTANNTFVLVSSSSVTTAPIRVSPEKSSGWRTLIVQSRGKGEVLMRFNGSRYPANPSSVEAMATPAQIAAAQVLLPGPVPEPIPVPGKTQTFKDWLVGCDNTLRCVAQALPEKEDFIRGVRIRRDGSPAVAVELSFPSDEKQAIDIIIDGKRMASATATDNRITLSDQQGVTLARAIAAGTVMELKAGDKVVGRISLAGSSAALRYMDAQQARANTTTALVALGARAAQTIPRAPDMPTVARVPPDPALKPDALSPQERAAVLKLADGCEGEPDVGALMKATTLVLVTCPGGPYNISNYVLVGRGTAGQRTFTPAEFDYDGGPILYNSVWDPATGRLSTTLLGRGLGDCGDSRLYVWNGSKFKLVEATEMGECRGSNDWLTIYRAIPTATR